ncbi:NAD(P)-binding protein [Ophiobolus disseminans]|uniref:NAD(P)-binding protein n=1 Tax=Ophiobolus disseminans TaxID=1469910 RepID=A0A6A6ZR05_9PLEO|nr:NAD(P)-binding protein [Ophiobolus disseminans]
MVAIEAVRASNTSLKSLPPLVAVFVGGTSGIGLFTARELARNTTSPHIYLVGRNQTEASKIIDELKAINSSTQVSFIQKDVSLLKNVDEACQEIKSKEKQVNLLFMTCGYFVFTGRDETSEGLDKKFALHYYTRMRFISQLQPLLNAAASSKSVSRVVGVLDPQIGLRLTPNFSDLSLKNTFSLKNCATHASAMTNLSFYKLARENTGTSYVHAYPGFVDTGAGRDARGALALLAKPIMWVMLKMMQVMPAESGERHLYAATSTSFAPQAGEDAATGSFLLNWNGDVLADTDKGRKLREEGKEDAVWEHTEDVFKKICAEGGKY